MTSKLVKLTNDSNLNIDDNSFRCQCDDDIIIEPNSSVSLINAHISSGILSNYKIQNTTIISGDSGEKLGDLYLTADKSDVNREILIESGNYNMPQLLQNMTKQFNKSLMFASSSSAISTTSNTLKTPQDLDFNLGVLCDLDDDKKVNIKFNSAPQKSTADMVFTNKNSGIDITNGVISYSSAPITINQTTLDTTKADNVNSLVFATNPSVTITDNSPVTLVNTAGIVPVLKAINKGSVVDSVSTDFSVTLDTTKADPVNLTVESTNFDNVDKYLQGDSITLDDGTGTPTTPSANEITATIDNIDNQFVNFNFDFDDLQHLQVPDDTALFLLNVKSLQPLGNNTYQFVVDVTSAQRAQYNLVQDAYYHILNSDNTLGSRLLILSAGDNQGNPDETLLEVQTLDGGSSITFDRIESFQSFTTSTLSSQNDLILSTDDVILFYSVDKSSLQKSLIMTFEPQSLIYNTTTSTGDILMKVGSMQSTQANTLIADQADLYQTLMNTFQDLLSPTSNSPSYYITSFNRLITKSSIQIGNFGIIANDILFANIIVPLKSFICNNTPTEIDIGANKFVIMPISSGGAQGQSPFDAYNEQINFILGIIDNGIQIFKDNNDQKAIFTLSNILPNATGLSLATRLWPGTGISQTLRYTLSFRQTSINLRNYDLLVVGDDLLPPSLAMCLEDSRVNHGCGRIAFLINTVGKCKLGLMPEQLFTSLSPLDNFFSVNIEGTVGNYVYTIRKGGTSVPLKTSIEALDGDRVIIQYGVYPSIDDFEYNDNISGATNSASITAGDVSRSSGERDESDRNKMLVSIIRSNQQNAYCYLGAKVYGLSGTNSNLSKTIPWTPRDDPYLQPQFFDSVGNYHVFVNPNEAEITLLELSPDATVVNEDGIIKDITPNKNHKVYFNADVHQITNVDLIDEFSKFKVYNNNFDFFFTNLNLQKLLGFRASDHPTSGLSGVISADINYLSSYLPENLIILLDNVNNIQTYDCNKNNGGRRNIICVAPDTQSKIGEINIEPRNLYKISLQNKEPINLKKYIVSFETYYGDQVILQSARACVNLLFESP